ncbi:hypothetical protein [Teredinibacter franksiae]|jgi:hypothetical protein|uniref:hypothetical protein n=1 Tax=Teredinibacter franksiae TaxID=2761453 RepID=UPI0016232BE8|nr:hypothetical protein [Teredinibacter franksiae]
MIKFNISKSLSQALSQHFEPMKQRTPSLIWDTELVSIKNELCIVVQERFSGYVMLFCGLKDRDFLHFPSLFQKRFQREVTVLCPEININDREDFCRHLMQMSDDQRYQVEPADFDDTPMQRIIEDLRVRAEENNERLPLSDRESFEYAVQFNCDEEESVEEFDVLCPLELFRDLCKNFVNEFHEKKRLEKLAARSVIGKHNNVITVNFGARSLAHAG